MLDMLRRYRETAHKRVQPVSEVEILRQAVAELQAKEQDRDKGWKPETPVIASKT